MVRGGKVPSSMERVYSRRRYLEKQRKLREHKKVSRRV